MDQPYRSERLDNGLLVEFRDVSNRYFGDYHRVRVEVICRLALGEGLFAGSADPAADCEQARKLLGPEIVFARSLEKMGVAGAAVEQTREELIQGFVESTFAYLGKPDFVSRLLARELSEARKARGPFSGRR
ncbi:hypothetical protein DESUT3_18900 [Desulfuromonas versatilis]|uniref:Uncharacterized protein n=1 Tax=Desulfuromonas versatilis TaxID=2802975 RepID=A0ABM8HW85_9BACT|nr:hypothetical protein [Desulfuromonas versatilis]BCR04821.1 hypothetical protein DESUT3_18900 [Desulfuromonas versatilis]